MQYTAKFPPRVSVRRLRALRSLGRLEANLGQGILVKDIIINAGARSTDLLFDFYLGLLFLATPKHFLVHVMVLEDLPDSGASLTAAVPFPLGKSVSHLLKYGTLVPRLHRLKVACEAVTVLLKLPADLHVRVLPLRELVLFVVIYLCEQLVP